jgi:hypothetical protein
VRGVSSALVLPGQPFDKLRANDRNKRYSHDELY